MKTRTRLHWTALACALLPCLANGQAKPELVWVKPSPWRAPFGLDRPGAPSVVRASVPDIPSGAAFVVEAFNHDVSVASVSLDSQALAKGPIEIPLPSFADKAVLIEEANGKRAPIAVTAIERAELDVEAVAEATGAKPTNPIDLGVVLPPQGWLVLGPGNAAVVRVAASWNGDDEQTYTVRAWFAHATDAFGTATLKTSRGDREKAQPARPFNHTDSPAPWEAHIALPAPPLTTDRSVLHVTLADDTGAQQWAKDIPVILVAAPRELPAFGAVRTKLRYDPPISVLDRETNALSTIPYEDGWDPALEDVVVALPGGGRFVFWRGSSYVPFWASPTGVGLSYEWAESGPLPGGFVDSVEPLMDKELRYGRVAIVESTAARVHVRWTYQSTDFNYKVWGDAAQEDYYFYPDGYGTRVLTLKSALDAKYELSEFIVIAPQDAYPLEFLPPGTAIATLGLDGERGNVTFPKPEGRPTTQSATPPLVYRAPLHSDDPNTAVYFNPRDPFDPAELTQFAPFFDEGEMVTPAYWGSHWPLSRGKTTGGAIDDRIRIAPSHNSLLSWAMNRPGPLSETKGEMVDALGQSREMRLQQWAWLIGYTAAADGEVLDMARSFAHPPHIERIAGARLEVESYNEARRALRMAVEDRDVRFTLTPKAVCINPVFELANAPRDLLGVSAGALQLGADDFAWDGHTLWLRATFRAPTTVRITFAGT